MHREYAVKYFNETWDLIDKKDRTAQDTLKMIHMAHASRFHWGEIGTSLEFSRGEWQLARVYALAHMPESALYHAQHALSYILENGAGDFDLAFAYEALARAHAVAASASASAPHGEGPSGHLNKVKHYLALAREAAEHIAKEEDKVYFLSELETIVHE